MLDSMSAALPGAEKVWEYGPASFGVAVMFALFFLAIIATKFLLIPMLQQWENLQKERTATAAEQAKTAESVRLTVADLTVSQQMQARIAEAMAETAQQQAEQTKQHAQMSRDLAVQAAKTEQSIERADRLLAKLEQHAARE